MQNHDDKYPARPGFEPGTSSLQAPIRMSHRGRPPWLMHKLNPIAMLLGTPMEDLNMLKVKS